MAPKSELVLRNGRIYHLGLLPQQLTPNIILVGDPARTERVAHYFDTVENEVSNREFRTISGTYRGTPVSVIGTGIGTDNVEIALVEAYILLAFDLATKKRFEILPTITMIRVGTSGGIHPDIPAGTLGIAEYGLGLDSTGLFYDHPAPDSTVTAIERACASILDGKTPETARFKGKILPYASKGSLDLIKGLKHHAQQARVNFISGITVSTPGFYGPSGRVIEGLNNTVPGIKHALAELHVNGLRVINMEMETSLMYHLGFHLGIRCGTICPIISNPHSSDSLVDYKSFIDQSIQIALTTLTAPVTP